MDEIRIEGIRVFAFHGCLPEESQIGTYFDVNVHLLADLKEAKTTDKLSTTIDYMAVNAIVQEEMGIRSNLIEHVAERIAQRIRSAFPQIESGEVEVVKHAAPMPGEVGHVRVIVEI
jgi:dihydroneopterin aldolase